jgi:endonuclease/exonuclease/phosphatase family metal-dependent hydrolase
VSRLTVLTQNLWGAFPKRDERLATFAERLAALRPEVVALQEVHAEGPSRTQAHELAAKVQGYRTFFAPARMRTDGTAEGIAILARHDARAHAPRALTLDPSDRFEGENQRIVLAVTLEHPEGPIDVFATHLSLSRRARTRTARELLDFVAEVRAASESIAAVLLGDLNATEGEPAVAQIEAEWIDVWRAAHGSARGGTWPAFLPLRRIDYVFAQPGERLRVERCERLPYAGSDHLGVLAELSVQVSGGP